MKRWSGFFWHRIGTSGIFYYYYFFFFFTSVDFGFHKDWGVFGADGVEFSRRLFHGVSWLVRSVMCGRTVAEFYIRGALPRRWWSNAHVQRSVVVIATGYGLNSSGFEARWRRDFTHLSWPALGPNVPSCTVNTVSFLGLKRPVPGVEHPIPV